MNIFGKRSIKTQLVSEQHSKSQVYSLLKDMQYVKNAKLNEK